MAVIATFFMNGEAEASFLAQGKSWLKFFQPQTLVTSQISRVANWLYCTTQQPNVVHACGNQCQKVSRTAARQFPALNFTELETLKYKSYSNIVSC